MGKNRRRSDDAQLDLFAVETGGRASTELDLAPWPQQERFPVNRRSASVRDQVWTDLLGSRHPLLIAGFSSIGELLTLIATWDAQPQRQQMRVLLGTEPFASSRTSFASPANDFAHDVREYWYSRGISVLLSASLLAARHALVSGRVGVRLVDARPPLHAKVYVGDAAATTGSSNFTSNGLGRQIEVNARFDRESEPVRYDELAQIGQNLWAVGRQWNGELIELLDALLRVVPWQEALARACSDILDGTWAEAYLAGVPRHANRLWPSQILGVAQAMWVIENVGSVLVADATGSGKTRMGAHLVRAVRDRLWATGRVRQDLTVLVCPPSVEDTWRGEAIACGLSIDTVSHGKLSRDAPHVGGLERQSVQRAQLLAVDEAHNFLNRAARRTRFVRANAADHVMLFTATPISRGASDLLDLIALLGPDNFDDAIHATMRKLERRGRMRTAPDAEEVAALRAAVQSFTVRRTKTQINRLVDEHPNAYQHPSTGRICRYPRHVPRRYETNETPDDEASASAIRAILTRLQGIARLPAEIRVPPALRPQFSDEKWLRFQLRSAAGLAAHHVAGSLRSSRAALYEHLHGSTAAAEHFGLAAAFKGAPTGNVLGRLSKLMAGGPPKVALECGLPSWCQDEDAWRAACVAERRLYEEIARLLETISAAREERKATLLAELARNHARVLAFDHQLITLAVLRESLANTDTDILMATGQRGTDRRKVRSLFSPDDTTGRRVIALCSDALNEGLNLQGASALVHLDLPTTLRVAEQRVGRVDRMDSRHDEIETWWPSDGYAFATRASEVLARRIDESGALLGTNLSLPDLRAAITEEDAEHDAVVDPEQFRAEVERRLAGEDDGLADALDPVRSLVEGSHALLDAATYGSHRHTTHRVLSRVAPLVAKSPWAFFAVASAGGGVPRWMFVAREDEACETELAKVVASLRGRLVGDPEARPLDEAALHHLAACLRIAAAHELDLLPRRSKRALEQLTVVAEHWARLSRRRGDEQMALRWLDIAGMGRPSSSEEAGAEPLAVAEAWLSLVAPTLEKHRTSNRGRRYTLLSDITKELLEQPLELVVVEDLMATVPAAQPFAERVSACIVGVPD